MSWWPLRRQSRKHKEQRERRHTQEYSEPISQHQSQHTVPDIITTPAEQLEQGKCSEPQKKTRIHHTTSTASTESEGYGSRDASTSSLPRMESSLPSLQGIPEESRQGTEVSPKSLRKNVSTTTVCSGSSTSSYLTAIERSHDTRHSPANNLEPPQDHSLKTRLEKLEKCCEENKVNRERLESRITELEDRVKLLESTQLLVSREDCEENDNRNALPVNLPVSTDVIIALAKRISRWKFLARYLGFQEHDIQRIHDEHQSDVQEQCFQMLWRWKQTHPSGGDYQTLGEAVRKDLGDSFYFDFVKLVTESEKSSQCTSPC